MCWKKWGYVKKGIVIAVAIWVFLILLYIIGGLFEWKICLPAAVVPPICYNPLQNFVLHIFGFLSLQVGSLNMKTGVPIVFINYIATLICFALWGALVGFIIKKIKKK